MGKIATSGAKNPHENQLLFAARTRCTTQNLTCCAIPKPNHGNVSGVMLRLSAVLATIVLAGFCCIPGQAKDTSGQILAGAPRPRADVIFIRANVYTGVPASAQYTSILRGEAIAVLGDRIQAVGKNADI